MGPRVLRHKLDSVTIKFALELKNFKCTIKNKMKLHCLK